MTEPFLISVIVVNVDNPTESDDGLKTSPFGWLQDRNAIPDMELCLGRQLLGGSVLNTLPFRVAIGMLSISDFALSSGGPEEGTLLAGPVD